ncbi:manganese/iron transport system ATP-binding protein [Microcella alkaliphila]|uniref:Manganese/iron transport system ATP-binding protein n=1 Tax=Microcella alkaliphila TaxID=279828 RepID=A0A4Q7TJQ1_9MICO|nr:manganese/iron transport system ATP-binding protein [Microcella alkaliphila]
MRGVTSDAPATAGSPTREPAVAVRPALSARGVTLRYGSNPPALSDVTLDVAPGEALAVIGPNGAGKSTFILGLLGLTQLADGELRVLDRTPAAARVSVGYVPQTAGLDPEFPVTLDQVVMMGRYRTLGWRWPGRRDRAAVHAALERVGLSEQHRTRFGRLSGGQQQRGLLARALVSSPRLLVLDEPFNGLDQTSRDTLLDIVRELKADGVAFVISTHDLDLARAVCDSVLLVNGVQVAAGPRDDVLTLDNLERVFAGHQVEVDEHTVVVPPHDGHA